MWGAQGREPVFKRENKVRTEGRRRSVPQRNPPSVRTVPTREARGWCGLQQALSFPREAGGSEGQDAPEAPFCLKNRNYTGNPISAESFLTPTFPSHPPGQQRSPHSLPPKLLPLPRSSRPFWALRTPRPAPSSISSSSHFLYSRFFCPLYPPLPGSWTLFSLHVASVGFTYSHISPSRKLHGRTSGAPTWTFIFLQASPEAGGPNQTPSESNPGLLSLVPAGNLETRPSCPTF